MSAVRSMLARVARLERAREAPRSPIEVAYCSLEAFVAEVQVGIDAGTYDQIDMPMVVASIRRWHREGAWEKPSTTSARK